MVAGHVSEKNQNREFAHRQQAGYIILDIKLVCVCWNFRLAIVRLAQLASQPVTLWETIKRPWRKKGRVETKNTLPLLSLLLKLPKMRPEARPLHSPSLPEYRWFVSRILQAPATQMQKGCSKLNQIGLIAGDLCSLAHRFQRHCTISFMSATVQNYTGKTLKHSKKSLTDHRIKFCLKDIVISILSKDLFYWTINNL